MLRWIVAALYAVVGALALNAAQSADHGERRFWIVTAIALTLLGLAKGLHLQDDLTDAGRSAAVSAGFYTLHATMQAVFAGGISLAAALGAFAANRLLTDFSRPAKAAAATLAFLGAFLLIRAASIHALDAWAMVKAAGMRRGWWIELSALAIVATAASLRRRT